MFNGNYLSVKTSELYQRKNRLIKNIKDKKAHSKKKLSIANISSMISETRDSPFYVKNMPYNQFANEKWTLDFQSIND